MHDRKCLAPAVAYKRACASSWLRVMALPGTLLTPHCASKDDLSLQHEVRSLPERADSATGAAVVVADDEAPSPPFFVAVHVGAGYHSPASAKLYRRAMHRACIAAASVLTQGGGNSLDAVVAAIKVLEDDTVTNAGRGSNLTEDGSVECDASVMDSRTGAFGAVGAVAGVSNVIEVAGCLARESMKGPLSLGRIPPIFLVGDGARVWAASRGLSAASSAEEAQNWLLTERAYRQWRQYKDMLSRATQSNGGAHSEQEIRDRNSSLNRLHDQKPNKDGNTDGCHDDFCTKCDDEAPSSDRVMDTVGAISVDSEGNLAAGVSSGGIAMKARGRVGVAAVYGCGCWACCEPSNPSVVVGCSVSGAGEQMVRSFAAHQCCSSALKSPGGPTHACEEMLQRMMTHATVGCTNDAGVLLLQGERTLEGGRHHLATVEVTAAHTAPSFGIGYFGSCMEQPKAIILRRLQGMETSEVNLFAARFVL